MLRVLAAADEFAHKVEAGRGNIETVPGGIGDLDVVLLHALHGHPLHAHEATEAVMDVDNQIAGFQVGIGLQLFMAAVLILFRLGLLARLGKELTLRQYRKGQGGILKTAAERAETNTHLAFFRQARQRQVKGGGDAALKKDVLQIFRPLLAGAKHQHRAVGVEILL